jgi:hypothetical protein
LWIAKGGLGGGVETCIRDIEEVFLCVSAWEDKYFDSACGFSPPPTLSFISFVKWNGRVKY